MDLGVVEKLWILVFQRHQNCQNPLSIDPVQAILLFDQGGIKIRALHYSEIY